MKKRLIFHFYLTNGWKEHHINKIHFYCLKYFAYAFNEVNFIIAMDNINDTKTIYDFENYILSLNLCVNITFKIKQNTIFRDSQTFYDEIAVKLKDLDGLTFFAHNKGFTNFTDSDYKVENIEKWVTAMYYGCLSRVEEMEHSLTDDRKISYGTLFISINKDCCHKEELDLHLGKNWYFYMGTFFWLNCGVINDFLNKQNVAVPTMNDRWYAENFFSNIIECKHCGYFDGRFTFDYLGGGWGNIDSPIKFSFGDHLDDYLNFHNKVLENI